MGFTILIGLLWMHTVFPCNLKGQQGHPIARVLNQIGLDVREEKPQQLGSAEQVINAAEQLGKQKHAYCKKLLSALRGLRGGGGGEVGMETSGFARDPDENKADGQFAAWFLTRAKEQMVLPKQEQHPIFTPETSQLGHYRDFLCQTGMVLTPKTSIKKLDEGLRKWEHAYQQKSVQELIDSRGDTVDKPFELAQAFPSEAKGRGWEVKRLNTPATSLRRALKWGIAWRGTMKIVSQVDVLFMPQNIQRQGSATVEVSPQGSISQIKGRRNSDIPLVQRSGLSATLVSELDCKKDGPSVKPASEIYGQTEHRVYFEVDKDDAMRRLNSSDSIGALVDDWLTKEGKAVAFFDMYEKNRSRVVSLQDSARNNPYKVLMSALYDGNPFSNTVDIHKPCRLTALKVGIEPPLRGDKRGYPVWVPTVQIQAHLRAGWLESLGHQHENADPKLQQVLPAIDLAQVPYNLVTETARVALETEVPF
jgi:hypothetical protein